MRTLYFVVKKDIDELDMYGLLKMDAPDDEFEYEALRISERISENDSIQQIASVIADVFNQAFDEHHKASVFLATAGRISQLFAENK